MVIIMVVFNAQADNITVSRITYSNVIVREGQSFYYVQMPEEGTVQLVAKLSVSLDDVQITQDPVERETLLERWKEANAKRQGTAKHQDRSPLPSPSDSVPSRIHDSDSPQKASKVLRLSGNAQANQTQAGSSSFVARGVLPYIQLNDIRLGSALKAILRSLNLDYRVQGDIIFITSPERLRTEAWEALETRVYHLNGAADTLPKVVVNNPMRGSNSQYGYGSYGYGGYSQGGYGTSRGYSGGGSGGVQGGMGYGGYRGGYGGGSYGGLDVTALGNISQLFTTIDDRLVGEPPARIGVN